MELKSQDGALFELSPVGYQFPSLASSRVSPDSDEYWLTIRGNVTMADGQSWSFKDPCLTTQEAPEIAKFMRQVVAGTIEPSVFELSVSQLLDFTEPNLAFSLDDNNSNRARIRIHFSLESLPPWLNGPPQPDIYDFFIVFDVEHKDLLQAAAQWETELIAFPQR